MAVPRDPPLRTGIATEAVSLAAPTEPSPVAPAPCAAPGRRPRVPASNRAGTTARVNAGSAEPEPFHLETKGSGNVPDHIPILL
jgi:hypothetical protein